MYYFTKLSDDRDIISIIVYAKDKPSNKFESLEDMESEISRKIPYSKLCILELGLF